MDSKVAFNIEKVVRVVKALRSTDGGDKLAMAGFNKEEDAVENKIGAIKNFYGRKYGGEVDDTVEEVPPTAYADEKEMKKSDEVDQAMNSFLTPDKEEIENVQSKQNGETAENEIEDTNEKVNETKDDRGFIREDGAVEESVSKETAREKTNNDGEF